MPPLQEISYNKSPQRRTRDVYACLSCESRVAGTPLVEAATWLYGLVTCCPSADAVRVLPFFFLSRTFSLVPVARRRVSHNLAQRACAIEGTAICPQRHFRTESARKGRQSRSVTTMLKHPSHTGCWRSWTAQRAVRCSP